MSTPNRIGIKGTVKATSRFGLVVGSNVEVTWELTNLSQTIYPGGFLVVTMYSPAGQYQTFTYQIPAINAGAKHLESKNQDGTPLKTEVMSEGYSLFTATLQNGVLEFPPGRPLGNNAFLNMLGISKNEVYTKYTLLLAVIGLIGTVITSAIQILLSYGHWVIKI